MRLFIVLLLLFGNVWADDTKKKAPVRTQVKQQAENTRVDVERLRDEVRTLEAELRKILDARSGKPANQSQTNRGLHHATGEVILEDGRAMFSLNTSLADGGQDVSFISKDTYHGLAWSTDSTNAATYTVYPLSGSSFLIKSSDTTDVSTVKFKVSGE